MSILKSRDLMERKRKIHQRALQHLPLQEKSVAVRNISKLSMYFEHVFKKKKQPARAAKDMGEPFSIGSKEISFQIYPCFELALSFGEMPFLCILQLGNSRACCEVDSPLELTAQPRPLRLQRGAARRWEPPRASISSSAKWGGAPFGLRNSAISPVP